MGSLSNFERDLDVFGSEYVQDAPGVWKNLREESPVVHTSLNGGGGYRRHIKTFQRLHMTLKDSRHVILE